MSFSFLSSLSFLPSSYRIFLLYILVPAVLFLLLLRVSSVFTAFPVDTLVCTIYLLNILFVLFWRGLSQINKLISPPSTSLCLPLFDLYLVFLFFSLSLSLSLRSCPLSEFRRTVGVCGGKREAA